MTLPVGTTRIKDKDVSPDGPRCAHFKMSMLTRYQTVLFLPPFLYFRYAMQQLT